MNARRILFVGTLTAVCAAAAMAQGSVVINDPTQTDPNAINDNKYKLSADEQSAFDKYVLPKVRKRLLGSTCDEETIELSGRHQGSFTKAGSEQIAIFYQFCQTGNGLGAAGVAILEGGRVVGNFV